jgi:predicted acetyltransferase
MPRLVPPTVDVHASFVEAMEEFRAEGRGGPNDSTNIGYHMREFAAQWRDPAVFATYVERVRGEALEATLRAEGWVPSTTLWWVDGTTYLGRIAVRHSLTEDLLNTGGSIGYDVRPSARRQGHATAMLRAALPEAAALGVDPALVTCNVANVGSRKVIEACGGLLEDQRGDKLRFWIRTSA